MTHVYFVKQNGLRFEVWFRREDGQPDPYSGATEWRACHGVRFWRELTAWRVAQACQLAHSEGYWIGYGARDYDPE